MPVPRLEQPASSMLWTFPELLQFLDVISAKRTHTWMKLFQHALPKPTVLFGNMRGSLLDLLHGEWSKALEERWTNMLVMKRATKLGIRKLMTNKKCFD